jgi:hypothetical protein
LKITFATSQKIYYNTEKQQKKLTKQQGDEFEVQDALALAHHLRARRRKEKIGSQPTIVSLRFREEEGGSDIEDEDEDEYEEEEEGSDLVEEEEEEEEEEGSNLVEEEEEGSDPIEEEEISDPEKDRPT